MKSRKSSLAGVITSSLVCLSASFSPVLAEAGGESSWQSAFTEGLSSMAAQRPDMAEQHFRTAFKLVKEQSKSTEECDKCELKLAESLTLRNKTAEAQQLYLHLLDSRTQRYGSNSKNLTPILFALGSIQEAEGDHDAAMGYYQRALKINEKNFGPYSPAVADNLHKMARVSQHAGKREDSTKHYKRALSILLNDPALQSSDQMERLMHDYSDLIKGNDNSNEDLLKDFKADIYSRSQSDTGSSDTTGNASNSENKDGWKKVGSTESSISSLPRISSEPTTQAAATQPTAGNKQSNFNQQVLVNTTQIKATQIDEDPSVKLRGIEKPTSDQALNPAYSVINNSLFNQSHYKRGVDYYERMIASDIDSLGPNHPSVANDLTGLAQLYIAQGRYSEAEQLLNRAVPIYQKAYGDSNVLTINAMTALATAEFQLGKTDRANELYRKTLANAQATLGPNSLEVARILNELAYLNYQQGKLSDAKTMYEWAVSSTQAAAGENSPLFAACLKDYAQVLRGMGDLAQATNAENRAEKILSANSKTN